MSAKEMFEELGYVQEIDTETIKGSALLIYKRDINNVVFNIQAKYYSGALYDVDERPKTFANELGKAINKQVEELGWGDK